MHGARDPIAARAAAGWAELAFLLYVGGLLLNFLGRPLFAIAAFALASWGAYVAIAYDLLSRLRAARPDDRTTGP